MTQEDRLKTKLNDVWRTCNKIRSTVFRLGINLWDFFKKLDPSQNRLISEVKFIGVIGQQLRNIIGLSEQEISELTDYFRVQDGRIAYAQFCGVIHDNGKVLNFIYLIKLKFREKYQNTFSSCYIHYVQNWRIFQEV